MILVGISNVFIISVYFYFNRKRPFLEDFVAPLMLLFWTKQLRFLSGLVPKCVIKHDGCREPRQARGERFLDRGGEPKCQRVEVRGCAIEIAWQCCELCREARVALELRRAVELQRSMKPEIVWNSSRSQSCNDISQSAIELDSKQATELRV